MWAPTDKRNDIVQICITRVCDLQYCSNCTQLLPMRKDAMHMGVDVFREAVRSLKGWHGVIALFGGNPVVHPHFPEIVKILCEEVPNQRQRGLWSNNLMKHGELIRKAFYPHGRFNLNAHASTKAAEEIDRWLPGKLIESSRSRKSWHSPILLNYKDFGIPDAAWIKSRENCDINRDWSSAIVERLDPNGVPRPYAYFCEVAAAIDGVRGTNHGVPAVPGWWRWKMDRFKHQVEQCCDKGCGVPLKRLGHLDRDDTYDYSPTWREIVESAAGSKTPMKIKLHAELPEGTELTTDYQAHRTSKPFKV